MWAAISGANSFWIACSESLVSAPARLENTVRTRSSSTPESSSASSVFAKVGGSGLPAIASTSVLWRAIASLRAGAKCSSSISANGGTPNGVVHSTSSGLTGGATAGAAGA